VLKLAQSLASSGFRDTSRVGGGNPELGMMMARYNKAEMVRSLRAYQAQFNQILESIDQEDWAGLEQILQQTAQQRPKFVGLER
jgi:arogenate dehydrogenase (NADP+)